MKTKIAILLFACLGMAGRVGHAQNENAQAQAAPTAVPAAKDAAQPKPTDLGALTPEKSDSDVIPSLQFSEDLPLAKILKDLAFQAGTNLMFDPQLSLPTNTSPAIKFENVTPLSALKAVMNNYGLILVGDPDTKIGRVQKKPANEPVLTRVLTLKNANPSNIVEIIRVQYAANTPKPVAYADPRTSQLVVSAVARDMDDITNMIASFDLPTGQILIEARIMETSRNPQTLRGIDWAPTLSGQNVSFGNGLGQNTTTITTPGASSAATTTLPDGRTLTTTSAAGALQTSTRTILYDALGSVPGISASTAGGFGPNVGFLSADGLKAVVSFLNQDADTKVVSTPRTVTLDNEPATLSVTRAFPIFTTTPGAANIPSATQVTWTNLGTILNVTPRIAGGDRIQLKVTPEVSSIDSKDTEIINGQQNSANVYAIRRMDTKVMIPSGHTLVMGGLMSDQKTKNSTGVPLLGSIPLLGPALFQHNATVVLQQNLIIFITPTIVRENDFTERDPKDAEFLKTKYVEEPQDDPKKAKKQRQAVTGGTDKSQ